MRLTPIVAAATRPVRRAILRPTQAEHELVYPGDDAPDTLHAGAFEEERLVGIASIYREARAGSNDAGAWRLRGMATLPDVRGRGYGAALLRLCIEYAAARGGRVAWCNARTSAAGFYEALGFVREGEAFELPGIGPHFVMSRAIASSSC